MGGNQHHGDVLQLGVAPDRRTQLDRSASWCRKCDDDQIGLDLARAFDYLVPLGDCRTVAGPERKRMPGLRITNDENGGGRSCETHGWSQIRIQQRTRSLSETCLLYTSPSPRDS